MRIKKKYVLLPLAVILVFAAVGYGTLRLMDTRSFQFFGGLVNRIETDQKVVALTFDDAPTLQVTSVLQTLAQKNVQATFFEIGSAIEKYPQLARAITQAGMQVGNHSYSHQRMVFQPFSFYQDEVDKTNRLIRATGYSGEIMFRPPHGKKLVGLPWYLSQQHIRTIMWDVEPDTFEDTGASNGDANFLVNYTLQQTKPGSIILLHPFCDKVCAADRAAIPRIIDGLEARGYQFVTISQLLTYAKK